MEKLLSIVMGALLCAGCRTSAQDEVRPHTMAIQVPTRLDIKRISKTISVTIDNKTSLVETNIVIDPGMGKVSLTLSMFIQPVSRVLLARGRASLISWHN